MTRQGSDPYGSTEEETGYDNRRGAATRGGRARSAWSLAVAVVFLVLIGVWFLLHPAGTDPAPEGSAGNGVVTTPSPTSAKP